MSILYYPQLSSGATGQFPISRRLTLRAVSNESSGGDTIRMADEGAKVTRWKLPYKNLTDAELGSIESLFVESEGRLNTFVFLDPADNLLQWSEDWSKPAWAADPLVQVTGGISDPVGGADATQVTNVGQARQQIKQTIAGASWFQYCFSMYFRSDVPMEAAMVVSSGSEESKLTFTTTPEWTRIVLNSDLTAKQDGISFGVELPAGGRIDAFGPQVEAQAAAGQYKKTTDRAGVYVKTRFEADVLTVSSDSKNCNSCVVELLSGE